MSAKETFYSSNNRKITGYQDLSLDKVNNNPVYLEMEEPEEFEVSWESSQGMVKLAIPADIFDEIAISWCQNRQLLK